MKMVADILASTGIMVINICNENSVWLPLDTVVSAAGTTLYAQLFRTNNEPAPTSTSLPTISATST